MQASGARGLFYDTRELLRVIRSTYDPSIRTTELEVLRPVNDANLLVLDDLGAEKDLGVGRGDDEPDRQHALQRAAADDLHLQLPGHPDDTIPTRCCSASASACDRGCTRCASSSCSDGADYR
jgi:hypothetical protein